MGQLDNINVLVVDDDEIDVMGVKRAFRGVKPNGPIIVANNGREALNKLRGGEVAKPYIILLDLNMPRMNGIEFLRELRQDPELCSSPVVVLTTSKDDRDKIDAYNLNVAGYLVKPVTFDSFCEVMVALNKFWTLVEML